MIEAQINQPAAVLLKEVRTFTRRGDNPTGCLENVQALYLKGAAEKPAIATYLEKLGKYSPIRTHLASQIAEDLQTLQPNLPTDAEVANSARFRLGVNMGLASRVFKFDQNHNTSFGLLLQNLTKTGYQETSAESAPTGIQPPSQENRASQTQNQPTTSSIIKSAPVHAESFIIDSDAGSIDAPVHTDSPAAPTRKATADTKPETEPTEPPTKLKHPNNDPEIERITQLLADPEKRKQVEEIISQIRSVYNRDGQSLFPLEIQLSDGSSDKRDLNLLDLQRQLSNILNLPEDESYQTLESIISIGQNIHLISLPRFINGNRQRGTLDAAIVLLLDMYTSTPKLQVQLQQAIDYFQDKGPHSNYSAFFYTQRAAAGVGTEQMEIIEHNDFTAINRLDKLFSNLFSDEEDIPVEEAVQAFIDRNRKVIICRQSQNEWDAKVGKFEQSLAKEHNIKITYGETQGDAILERMTPAEIMEDADRQIRAATNAWRHEGTNEPSPEVQQEIDQASTRIARVIANIEDPVEAAHLLKSQRDYVRYYARPALARLFPDKYSVVDAIMAAESKAWVEFHEAAMGKQPKEKPFDQVTELFEAAKAEIAQKEADK